jgi:hypothetical protein
MKGTMSELELSVFRQRSHEALKQKTGRDRIEKDPDQQVRFAVGIVFANRPAAVNSKAA